MSSDGLVYLGSASVLQCRPLSHLLGPVPVAGEQLGSVQTAELDFEVLALEQSVLEQRGLMKQVVPALLLLLVVVQECFQHQLGYWQEVRSVLVLLVAVELQVCLLDWVVDSG